MVMENLEEPGTASKAKLPSRGANFLIMMFSDHELEDEKLASLLFCYSDDDIYNDNDGNDDDDGC